MCYNTNKNSVSGMSIQIWKVIKIVRGCQAFMLDTNITSCDRSHYIIYHDRILVTFGKW